METKNFISTKQAREIIKTVLDSKEELTCTLGDIELKFITDNIPDIYLKGRDFTFIEQSFEEFCKKAGFPPVKFIDRLSANPKLRNDLLDFCLTQASDKSLSFSLVKGTDMILSIENGDVENISPLHIFENCFLALPEGTLVESINLNGGFDIRFLASLSDSPRKRDDITRGGVFVRAIKNQIEIGEYLFTLQCSNGLIGESKILKKCIHTERESRQVLSKVKETVGLIFADVKERLLPSIVESDEVQVKDKTQLIHRLSREIHLPFEMEAFLMDMLPSLSEPCTYYDVINLVTHYGSRKGNDSLLRFGGKILKEVTTHTCSRCHRPVSPGSMRD